MVRSEYKSQIEQIRGRLFDLVASLVQFSTKDVHHSPKVLRDGDGWVGKPTRDVGNLIGVICDLHGTRSDLRHHSLRTR